MLTRQTIHSLPDQLHLSQAPVRDHVTRYTGPKGRGVRISANAGGAPLLVGHRYGSSWRNRLKSVSLCLGEESYASAGGPGAFIKATDLKTSIRIVYRSGAQNAPETYIKTGAAVKSPLGTKFSMAVPDLADNKPALQDFEWWHRRPEPVNHGARTNTLILVQRSTSQVVARMVCRGKVKTGDFDVEFLGAGRTYGGIWKILSFVIGILAF